MVIATRSAIGLAMVLLAVAVPAFAGTVAKSLRAEAQTDLPLVEHVPGAAVPNVCVVFFSGDGGWADLDRTIASSLVQAGYPVIGVDSLRWFLYGRSAGRSGRDLFRILMYYHRVLSVSRFALAGYSRGAEALPFMVRRLPAEARGWVRLVALLAPNRTTDFQTILIHAARGGPPAWALRPLRPEVDDLRGMRLLGFYGADEAAVSLCTEVPGAFSGVYALPGGHHFGGDPRHHANYVKISEVLQGELEAMAP